jgi:hypothetical protein
MTSGSSWSSGRKAVDRPSHKPLTLTAHIQCPPSDDLAQSAVISRRGRGQRWRTQHARPAGARRPEGGELSRVKSITLDHTLRSLPVARLREARQMLESKGFCGATRRIRTDDLLITNQLLYRKTGVWSAISGPPPRPLPEPLEISGNCPGASALMRLAAGKRTLTPPLSRKGPSIFSLRVLLACHPERSESGVEGSTRSDYV